MDITELLRLTIGQGSSDLHLIAGTPPVIRTEGRLSLVQGEAPLTSQAIENHLSQVMSGMQLEELKKSREVDFSHSIDGQARFRVNAYFQQQSISASFRTIPLVIPSIDSLGLPKFIHNFTEMRQGFVLVTGPTGHGKSTTLAAVLDEINMNRSAHIITIEDPIEFVFSPQKSIISQREIGSDTLSWDGALRSALREDPDVVLVGEMRDRETIATALTVAETGHLVFATLHTNSAAQTIDRIVDVFPEEQQGQVRLQLSEVLQAVFSQRLVPSMDGHRVLAYEVMMANHAVKTEIREGKTHQINSIIQTSRSEGMNTLEDSLANLVKNGLISVEVARSYSLNPEQLNRLIRQST